MKTKKTFFMTSIPTILAACSLFTIFDTANAASRVALRGTAMTARKSVTAAVQKVEPVAEEVVEEVIPEPIEEPVVLNKSNQFEVFINEIIEDSDDSNSFAAEIRKQRAAIAARESQNAANDSLNNAMRAGTNSCDIDLRKCMVKLCGNDFTKCALDGDTDFGDKLNKCKRETKCSASEFSSFSKEIKEDRDMNVRLASYENIVSCGNQYNACIVNECGTTYSKCLGKSSADAAIEKCKTIATECTESDSGLASRFGTAIGKLRESAEAEVKSDEQKLYTLRDSMGKTCKSIGAMFDERSFDCVYTINFFAGEDQDIPMASRKGYAGDTFTCMQEWFGINATTYKENAYRETRSQTAASSAMLGAGLGTAGGLITSGAINRAIDTQKAKKELDEERILQGKPTLKEEENARKEEIKEKKAEKKAAEKEKKDAEQKQEEEECRINRGGNYVGGVCYCKGVALLKGEKCANNHIVGRVCTIKNATMAKYDENGVCVPSKCIAGYKPVNVGGWYCGVDQKNSK